MIDTIKLAIPLSKKQHALINNKIMMADREQWALFNPSVGEFRLVRVKGLFQADQNSYHREIKFDISPSFIPDNTYLTIELSLPKFWYGHNIWLLYGFTKPLVEIKKQLEQQFGLCKKNKLLDILTWQVHRLDICYAWKFPSQSSAKAYLDSLKHLHFPRKEPTYFTNGIQFVGRTYSVKFYLKYPEFRQHDLPELKKQGNSFDYINFLETEAEGVLRYEATLRKQYLKLMKVQVVADLFENSFFYVDKDLPNNIEAKEKVISILFNMNIDKLQNLIKNDFNSLLPVYIKEELAIESTKEETEKILNNPEVKKLINSVDNKLESKNESFNKILEQILTKEIVIQIAKINNVVLKLKYFLTKFIGENSTMQEADKVKEKLHKLYKPSKVARLVGFWLYVQRFGTNEAKEIFGRNPYYQAKADLKKAGVSLVEPPDNVIRLDEDFFRNFKLEVPSNHVVNRVDNERDSQNLLNFCDFKQGKDGGYN